MHPDFNEVIFINIYLRVPAEAETSKLNKNNEHLSFCEIDLPVAPSLGLLGMNTWKVFRDQRCEGVFNVTLLKQNVCRPT